MTGAPWEKWSRVGAQWPRYNVESDQANGLVAWWSCFAGEPGGWGLLRDVLGRYDMAAYNAPTVVGGEMGPVVQLDNGSSQYLEYGGAVVDTVPLSIAMWFRADANLTQYNNFALATIADLSGFDYFRMYLATADKASSGIVYAQHRNGGVAAASVDVGENITGTWRLAVAVFESASSRTVYCDGSSGSDATSLGVPVALDITCLGATAWYGSHSSYFGGCIAEARCYDRALSDNEVHALYDLRTRWELYQIPKRVWYVGAAGDIDQVATVSWANVGQLVGVAEASISEVAGVVAN